MTEGELYAGLRQQAESSHELQPGDEWEKRISLAASCGSLDAKHMVHMSQTFGFPLWEYIATFRKHDSELAIPWDMLRFELLCIGKTPNSIDSLFRELKEDRAV